MVVIRVVDVAIMVVDVDISSTVSTHRLSLSSLLLVVTSHPSSSYFSFPSSPKSKVYGTLEIDNRKGTSQLFV